MTINKELLPGDDACTRYLRVTLEAGLRETYARFLEHVAREAG